MVDYVHSPTTRGGLNAVLRVFVAFPIACFSCALATDLAYLKTANMMWADFSAWLLAIGMLFGGLAAVVALIALIAYRDTPERRPGLPLMLGGVLTLVFGMVNNLVHSRDAWTSVVPTGLSLSVATVVVLLITTWLSSAKVSAGPVNVRYSGARP